MTRQPSGGSHVLCISNSRDGGRVVARTEYCRSGDNRVGAGFDGQCGIVAILSAVDLDPRVEPLRLAEPAQLPDFRQHLRQEFLSAKSGIDGHHQDDVAEVQHLLDERDRAGRVEHRAGLLAQLPDAREHAMQMDRRRWLALNKKVIGAGFGKIFKIAFGLDDHQVHIERLRGRAAHRIRRPQGRTRCSARTGRP